MKRLKAVAILASLLLTLVPTALGSPSSSLPPVPKILGACFVLELSTNSWSRVPCLPPDAAKVGTIGNGAPDVFMTVNSGVIYEAQGQISFGTLTGEVDQSVPNPPCITNSNGLHGAYSVQLNTNTFTDSQSNTGWYQFAEQQGNNNTRPLLTAQLWNGLTQSSTNPTMYNAPFPNNVALTKNTNYNVQVQAGTINGQPYFSFLFQAGSNAAAENVPDTFNLQPNWTSFEYNMYGVGCLDSAIFTPPTSGTVTLSLTPQTANCMTSQELGTETGETNNLNINSFSPSGSFCPSLTGVVTLSESI
jgi:hypothetical protein